MSKFYSFMKINSGKNSEDAKIVIRNDEEGIVKEYKISAKSNFPLNQPKHTNLQSTKNYIKQCFPEAEEIK